MEQREVKNHWLAEKADLQSRLCQVQALNTQIQGTLKKKEKEFDRLQIQLSKVVKDAARNSKATLFISAPLKKAMSQDNTSSSTQLLRDPEIIALKNSMLHMERENIGLRSTVENMQGDLTDLQESFDKAIKAAEEKYRIQLESVKQERIVNTKFIENVQKNTIVEEEESVAEEDVLVELVASAVPTPAATPLPAKSCSLTITVPSPHTPCSEPASLQGLKTPGTIAKKYLEGTPGARPVSWIVQQANTEVKRLRERADNVAVGNGFSSDLVSIGGSYSMDAMMKINALRARLSEALVVIQEQDRLIHDGKSSLL